MYNLTFSLSGLFKKGFKQVMKFYKKIAG